MQPTIEEVFGQRVRKLRVDRQISQEELAYRAGIHRTYIGAVERGERNISLRNMGRLSVALEITLSELVEDVK